MNKSELLQIALRDYRYDPETGELFKRVGHPAANGYQRVMVGPKYAPIQAHRLAWAITHKEWPKGHVDHINGNRSDNRVMNLRDVSHSMNLQNQRKASKNSKSGLLGASWSKAMKRWTARIHYDGKHHFLGYFDTAQEAHDSYLLAKRLRHAGCTI